MMTIYQPKDNLLFLKIFNIFFSGSRASAGCAVRHSKRSTKLRALDESAPAQTLGCVARFQPWKPSCATLEFPLLPPAAAPP